MDKERSDNRVKNDEYKNSSSDDNSNISNGSNSGSKDIKGEELQRITVSKQVQEALTVIIDRVNDGFIGGKINRTQAINWIIMRFNKNLSEADIKEIRIEYYDEIAVLESIFRRAKESGKVPNEFKALLQKQLEINDTVKKKSKKVLTGNVLNDDIM